MQPRIGVVGVGDLGIAQAQACADLPDVSLVCAADPADRARRRFESTFGAPAYESLDGLLRSHGADLDGVVIATPHTLHHAQVTAALEADCHVMVEKPMVTDVEHARDLVGLAAERALVLQVGYQRHYDPAFCELRRILRSGRVGDLRAVNGYVGQDWIEPHRGSWRTAPSLSGGGFLYDTGSHLLDALCWLVGREPQSVAATIEYDEPGVDVDSACSIQFEQAEEPSPPVTAGVTMSGDGVDATPIESYCFWGTDGRVTYADGVVTVTKQGGVTYRAEVAEASFQSLNRTKLANFADAIRGDEQTAVPGEFGVTVTALTEAIYRADETGERTPVQVETGD